MIRFRIIAAICLLCLAPMSYSANAAETDKVFDYEITKLQAQIKELHRVMSVKDMTKEPAERIGVELSLLNGQLGNVKSAKTSTDASVQVQYANSIVTKYISIYSYSVKFRKDYNTRRKLHDAEVENLKDELAKFKKWQKELKTRNRPDAPDKK